MNLLTQRYLESIYEVYLEQGGDPEEVPEREVDIIEFLQNKIQNYEK